ncbi:hypothetical protein GCK72_010549 [Caenorhabditis remanei]|uniref:Uncharacterized protein n=1 Tax=Caenorhabditis remanei TaxID=31234 RepID=A0A6A5H525_CAERE|nr:hypothetical protein GCK72_010549 [Caenorhabditis remanei]KAF1762287.1 hypothetical protein GCK72_010549 [Caenorhabditis remanei]
MASLPRSALRELLVTRYVPKIEDIEVEEVETARAGCSVLQPKRTLQNEDIIEAQGEDVELVEDENYRSVHRIDETPKLIVKKPNVSQLRDEAVKVLRNLKKTPAETLRLERYEYLVQRWFHTSRESEKELVEYVLLHPNHRPYLFTMQCRHIYIEDLAGIILKSLLSEPRETGQCLARFAIQTTIEMPFAVLYSVLENMVAENEGFQLSDGIVTASILSQRGNRSITHRLKTDKCKEYGQLEPELDNNGGLIASTASIRCSVKGKQHVEMQVVYRNNSSSKNPTARNRYIELEQTVKCMNRRVLIMEEQNELVEFEVEKDMIPLKNGVPPVDDLISFLKMDNSDIDSYSD